MISGIMLATIMIAYGDAGAFGKLSPRAEWVLLVLVIVIIAVCGWSLVALTVKRLHDLGWSGWLAPGILAGAGAAVFLDDHFPPGSMALIVALIAAGLWLLFMPGQLKANAHGPPPA